MTARASTLVDRHFDGPSLHDGWDCAPCVPRLSDEAITVSMSARAAHTIADLIDRLAEPLTGAEHTLLVALARALRGGP